MHTSMKIKFKKVLINSYILLCHFYNAEGSHCTQHCNVDTSIQEVTDTNLGHVTNCYDVFCGFLHLDTNI